jgi:DNA mismatch repair protein MutH
MGESREEMIINHFKELMDQSHDSWVEVQGTVKLALAARVEVGKALLPHPGTTRETQEQAINEVVDMLTNRALGLIDDILSPISEAIRYIQQLPYGDDVNEVGSEYPQS